MREATARGPSIDITEFERRLRGAEPANEKHAADPLAELARLLHGDEAEPSADPYGRVFEADRRRAETRGRPAAPPAPPPPSAPAYHDDYHSAELRGSLPPQPAVDPQSYHYPADQAAQADWSHHESQDYLDYGAEADAYDQYEQYEEEEPQGFFAKLKSKLRPWHAVAGIAAIGAVSVGWSFAHRNGVIAPREIATINAPEGPAKVQPSTVAEAASPQRGATILDRNESAPVKKVVSHEEQPVDPTAAARVVRLGDGPVDAPHEPAAPAAMAAEPKKVKTVSVRPDGTVIDKDAQAPAIARPAPPPPPSRTAALGSNPTFALGGVDAAAPTATPKSPAKPATTPRAAQPPRKPEKPVSENAAERPASEQIASIETPAADAAGAEAGGFAVQFGAAGSEAEARQLLQTISQKYRAQLGGHRLGYRFAKVGEKSVYRVRVAGMSKEAAVGICEKVKAAGGNCFVAGN